MNIEKRAEKARMVFYQSTGVEPNVIYAGEKEVREILSWALDQDYCIASTDLWRGRERPEIFGMLVFQVNAESHFYIANEMGLGNEQ